jgi:hypothetical protein
MSLILTVTNPSANIRRGPTISASRFAEAKIGNQFEVIQLIDLKPPEQWAKIILPEHRDVDAYICVTMPTGAKLCQVSNVPTPPNAEYQRGWNDCLDAVHQAIVWLRK